MADGGQGTRTEDSPWMARALLLARQAASEASPNPTVGCVLVGSSPYGEDEALGEGAHRYDARDHAEIVALKAAAASACTVRGSTAYVTLEPCAHHGRTGPCAEALVAAGVARCVIATVDPNPLVRGQGIAILRAGDVAVEVLAPGSPLAQAARRLNDAFAFAIQHGRPFVTLKAAVSLDGRLAPNPAVRAQARSTLIGSQARVTEPYWLTADAAREDVQRLRHSSDAILTGIGTVLADDPTLTDRTGLVRRRPLLRAVLDRRLRTPPDSKLVQSADGDLLLFCGEDVETARENRLQECGVEIMRTPADASGLDLLTVMRRLGERGVRSVLVEGGTNLNGSLLREHLADKLVLYVAPTELGAHALPFAADVGSPFAVLERLQGAERRSFPHGSEEDVRISGYLHDPWAGMKDAEGGFR